MGRIIHLRHLTTASFVFERLNGEGSDIVAGHPPRLFDNMQQYYPKQQQQQKDRVVSLAASGKDAEYMHEVFKENSLP